MSHEDGSGKKSGLLRVLAGFILVLAIVCLSQQRTIHLLKERAAGAVEEKPGRETSTLNTAISSVKNEGMLEREPFVETEREPVHPSDRENIRILKRESAILRQERDILDQSNFRNRKEVNKLRSENSDLAVQIAGLKAQPARPGAWIGILVGSPTLEDPHDGVAIGAVIPFSPADKAKLKKDDLILSIDGEKAATQSDVVKILSQKLVGVPISLQIKRRGTVLEVAVETVGGPGSKSISRENA